VHNSWQIIIYLSKYLIEIRKPFINNQLNKNTNYFVSHVDIKNFNCNTLKNIFLIFLNKIKYSNHKAVNLVLSTI